MTDKLRELKRRLMKQEGYDPDELTEEQWLKEGVEVEEFIEQMDRFDPAKLYFMKIRDLVLDCALLTDKRA